MESSAINNESQSLLIENSALKEILEKQKVEISELNTINLELTKYLNLKTDGLNVYEHLAAHDIKTSLRRISNYINSVRINSSLNKSIDADLNSIDNSLEKMDNLLTNVLKYTNLSVQNNHKNVDLNKILTTIFKLTDNPNKVAIKVQDKLPVINFNRKAIEQIFMYLIGNALNNANKKNGIIEIAFKEHPDYYLFMVRDNGSEVKESEYGNIFNLLSSLNSDDKNSGISLAMVKKIVILYGGKIWSHHQKYKGTTFYFSVYK